jgi:colanic acid/amylovoran biosynthesis glycosyltransferase
MNPIHSNKPVCAHYVSQYLPLTENWIYRVLINHQEYLPIMLSRKKVNLNLFPFPALFCLTDFNFFRKYLEIIFFRIFDFFYFFKQVCQQQQVQILHIHFGYHGVKFIGLKKVLNIPMVCSFYGDDAFSYPLRKGFTKKYRTLFKVADRILVLGPYMKAELIKLGCPEEKILIHHLGIDVNKIEFRKREMKSNDVLRFMIASSFLEKKGIALTIRALAAFKDKYQFLLDIIGDGPLRPEIEAEIEKGGLNDRVMLHGYKPYDFVIQLAYQCHVFIQASLTGKDNNKEGTPMAIVDAMATGMTVISTQHSDIPEIVIDGVNGYLAQENDVESLQQCIRKVFENPEKLTVFSMRAREWVVQEFNAQKQTAKLEALYTSLQQH